MASFVFLILVLVLIYVFLRKKDPERQKIEFPAHFWPALAAAVLALNVFAYQADQGLGMGIFMGILALSIAASRTKDATIPMRRGIALMVLMCGLLFGLRANDFVQEVNGSVTLIGILALCFVTSLKNPEWKGAWLLRAAKKFVIRCCEQPPILLTSIMKKDVRHPAIFSTVKTLVITIVLLLFFAEILSKADPIFADLIKEIREQLLERSVLSALLALGLTWALSIRIDTKDEDGREGFLGFYETVIPTASVLILFSVFLFIQAKYLFGSHGDFQALDITYSDYVRRGFKELLTATFFGGLLSYVVRIKTDTFTPHSRVLLTRTLNVLLVLALALLLASAFKRNQMYMETYGLTRVRIVGTIFLVWLAAALILQTGFITLKKFHEAVLLKTVAVLSVAAVLALNVMNIDGVIAKSVPPRNEPRDYFYVNALSADAIGGWRASIDETLAHYDALRLSSGAPSEHDRVRLAELKLAMELLAHKRDELMIRHDMNWKWQNFNLAEWRAYSAMLKELPMYFATVDCLRREIEDYQITRSVDLWDQEQKRLYEYDYPFLTLPSWWYYPQDLSSLRENRTAEGRSLRDPAQSCGV